MSPQVECKFYARTVPNSSCKKLISEDSTTVMCPVMHGGKCVIEGVEAIPTFDYPAVDKQVIMQAFVNFIYNRSSH